MSNAIKSKRQVFVTALLLIYILFVITLQITVIDKTLLSYVEVFFHKTLRKPEKWIDIIQKTSRVFLIFILTVYFLAYTHKGILLHKKIGIRLFELKELYINKYNFKILAGLCLFFYIAYYNILTANYFYADDVFRNYGGDRSWIGFSRYISEFCSIIFHNSIRLNDIAPLTQFFSIIISSITLIVLSIAFTESLKIKYILALSLIFITPFYAENISYRFDSPYMALSLLFTAIPFLFKKDKALFIFVSVLSLLLTCFSYQAALSLYILSVIFIFAKGIIDNNNLKNNIYFVLYSIISFIITLVIFKLFFMIKMDNEGYFSIRTSLSAILPNAIKYIQTTFTHNGGILLKLIFILSIILLLFNIFLENKKNKLFLLLFMIAVITISYILSFGPYLVFEQTLLAPRALMGFNTLFAFILLGNTLISEKSQLNTKKLSSLLTFAAIYSCIVFLFSYGNCLKNQKEYENFRTQLIMQDIATITNKNENYNISFFGNIGMSAKCRIAIRNYPIIKTLIQPRPSGRHIWNEELIQAYNFNCTDNNEELTEEYKLVKENYYHTIYKSGNNFIIELKD